MIEKTLQELTEQIVILADHMEKLRSALPPVEIPPAKKAPAKKKAKAKAKAAEEPVTETDVKQFTLDEARDAVVAVSETCGRDQAKALVQGFGVTRLGEMAPESYGDLVLQATSMLESA